MRASFLVGPRASEVREIPRPSPADNEVLLRVEACGVCASELHIWRGDVALDYPMRMGHEPSGVIEEIGSRVEGLEIGQRVAVLAPGSGAFAEYITVPHWAVLPMPAEMTFAEAMAEPVGCLISGLGRTEVHLGDRAAIVGCGFMGLALLQLVANRGVREIVAVDVRQVALENALRFGADRAVLAEAVAREDKVVTWEQIGQGVDVVFETTGSPDGLTLAGEMVRTHGVLSIVGWHTPGMRTLDIGLWNWKAITVINAHERRDDHLVRCMEAGLRLVAAGKLDLARLVTHTYALEEVDGAFADMEDKPEGLIKGVALPQA